MGTLTYPYDTAPLEALHPDGWPQVEPTLVKVADLTPTQPDVSIDRLVHHHHGGEPETGDPYPHVVMHRGRLYVHDGHHRYVLALLRGDATVFARVVAVNRRPRL